MGTKISIQALYERDNGICGICGNKVTIRQLNRGLANRDHIIPVSLGGNNYQTNLRLAHSICNVKRGNGLPNNGDSTQQEKYDIAYIEQDGRCFLCDEDLEGDWSTESLIRHRHAAHRLCIRLDRGM
ncbi:HNH endonuclease [Streptomyces phage MulchMansion]|nr:HNH endonuclease [Streptomyces phage MulchMansion]UVK61210.1 HNH endonuclease [Streptomyces phage Angela]